MNPELLSALAAAGLLTAALALAPKGWRRLQLSRAKHPSLAGHSRMAVRLARLMPTQRFGDDRFFDADDATPEVVQRRRASFEALSRTLQERHARSIEATAALKPGLPDLQFTSGYRVPPPFSPVVQKALPLGAVMRASDGHWLTDLDGQRFIDLAGSYGVNLFGYAFYQRCIAEGSARVAELGPVLGVYHPLVQGNVQRLLALSGMDQLSFHMSGTEAVMQAVRLARYHTGRTHLVRFCGAYHGWWDEAQPGPGNPLPAERTYTLRDMHARSLQVLRTRRDIACVLVNPLQALHPNRPAPGDGSLVDSSRRAAYDREAYAAWLRELRQVCTERGIALIFDEVFMGFRLGVGGAQAYFGVQADLVTYGKTLGGGLPVGVVCGKAAWMKRYREERPADICFARGTFNTHPYVMGAMSVFLDALEDPAWQQTLVEQDAVQDRRRAQLNAALEAAGLPVRAANMSSVWTLYYLQPSRYNWMLQYFMRAQGLALSWVGTGRMIFSTDFTDADFDEVQRRLLVAAQAMRDGGWWAGPDDLTNQSIKRRLLLETLGLAR
ncbi:aminotransferase class III-fold pyridoxal phosphate-dependent enzyme [Roseateles depolymerans]|uniref:Glutamate-1-semialdehyde 2,1-aminomutase n=1 Tax=Roseateles depolymerans TaxID=76731 RepID=A0A0U3MIS8_9BURK|nr:aminotransferase class III-fold pyridoxal phosphate-dependent enzyme [Roseateles depolymerans]ALV08589.1 glutamate-1-semialdehyde 2,1-aminomutase [Roseateles depolymerans]REG21185.1 glutamate-1-semialdehyde 2,1-aminomutase [Roseateles depolymerans]